MLQDPPPTIQLVIMQAVFFTYSDKLIRDLQFLRGHGRGGDKENKTESNLHSALDAKSESPTHAEYVFHLRAFQINIFYSLPFCNDCSKFWRHQKTLFSSVKSQGNCTTHLKTKMGSGHKQTKFLIGYLLSQSVIYLPLPQPRYFGIMI